MSADWTTTLKEQGWEDAAAIVAAARAAGLSFIECEQCGALVLPAGASCHPGLEDITPNSEAVRHCGRYVCVSCMQDEQETQGANMPTHTHTGVIFERGNGLAVAGDYVSGNGELYEVIRTLGPIRAGDDGSGNSIRALLRLADWDDLTDAEAEDVVCAVHYVREVDGE